MPVRPALDRLHDLGERVSAAANHSAGDRAHEALECIRGGESNRLQVTERVAPVTLPQVVGELHREGPEIDGGDDRIGSK